MRDISKPDLADGAKAQKNRVASSVGGAANQVARQRERAVEGTRDVAEKVRERAGTMPGSDKAVQAVRDTASRLKDSAGDVRARDLSSIGGNAVNLVKRHPVKAGAVGLAAVLLLVGRILRSSSDAREAEDDRATDSHDSDTT